MHVLSNLPFCRVGFQIVFPRTNLNEKGKLFWGPTKVGSANLERSYRRAPKGAGQNGDFEVEGAGICHLCTCGMGVDWENLSLLFCIELIQTLLFLSYPSIPSILLPLCYFITWGHSTIHFVAWCLCVATSQLSGKKLKKLWTMPLRLSCQSHGIGKGQ